MAGFQRYRSDGRYPGAARRWTAHADQPTRREASSVAGGLMVGRTCLKLAKIQGAATRNEHGSAGGEAVSKAGLVNTRPGPLDQPTDKEIHRKARNRKNRICAMPAEAPAMPLKPSTPAM